MMLLHLYVGQKSVTPIITVSLLCWCPLGQREMAGPGRQTVTTEHTGGPGRWGMELLNAPCIQLLPVLTEGGQTDSTVKQTP